MGNYDFSGYATKANLKCSDGRVILTDAFKHNDGQVVPLVWNHQHNDVNEVLGHALLENRKDGVYAYGTFNDTESGQTAKLLVQHGDVTSMSIYANQLKQKKESNATVVSHGNIREVSLVLAGANIGAKIDHVIMHGEDFDEEEAIIYAGEELSLCHSEEEEEDEVEENSISHAEDDKEDKKMSEQKEKTVQDVFDSMTEEQKTVVYAMIGQALEDAGADDDDVEHSEGGDDYMKHNVFENDNTFEQGYALSHADQETIIKMAKQSNVGSLKNAMEIFAEENSLQHGIFEDYEVLFPEYELLNKGEPETLERDQSWVAGALAKMHKSPFSRIRTRYADARIAELKAKGYQKKGDQKTVMSQIKLLGRTTDPQTIYIKDDLHRDDIIDVTDFSVVAYQWKMMRHVLDETIALSALIGDGREDGDPDKIHDDHVRPIWTDDDLYTIKALVDINAAKEELQGTDTSVHFGDNYIYAEAIITAALYSREKYKGTGTPDFYCTPHLVNVMLLARDLNGRRIYDSKADLARALNVNAIHEVEQFEGRTRTNDDGDKFGLLGLFVNLADYQVGSTKGGEITKFEDFDMDFNKQKYMLETRLSGALTKPYSAIALEEPIA